MGNFVIYVDLVGEFRWYLMTSDNRKLADSADSYRTRHECEDGIRLMKRVAPMAKVDQPAAKRAVETLV
jgi:uncharacterized protein